MLYFKLFSAFFVGVLAVQAKPQIKNESKLEAPIDDVIRELEELNRVATTEQQQATDSLGGELRSVGEISENILHNLVEELNRDVATALLEISGLQERAYELGVDIRECIGNSLDEIDNLPLQLAGEAGVCLNLGHAQAERAVNEGVRKIEQAIGPIAEYWREVERCRASDPRDQEVCVAALNTQIRNDEVLIPSKIHLAVEEVLGHLEAEKTALLICATGKVDRFNEEAGRTVRRVTECAEEKFPPQPTPFR